MVPSNTPEISIDPDVPVLSIFRFDDWRAGIDSSCFYFYSSAWEAFLATDLDPQPLIVEAGSG